MKSIYAKNVHSNSYKETTRFPRLVLKYLLIFKRLTTRTEQLTKCCEPLQKMRVRLGPCKNDFVVGLLIYVLESNFCAV